MPSSATQNKNRRSKYRDMLCQPFRHKPRVPSNSAYFDSNPEIKAAPGALQADLALSSKHATFSTSSQTRDVSKELPTTENDASQIQTNVHGSGIEQNLSIDHLTLGVDADLAIVSSNLWSAAYNEAVDSLGEGMNVAILKGENVAELFSQLEKVDKETTQESAFLRGVGYLHSLQVPLERFKLALDLAAPLANIEPTAAMAFGVVRSVTAIAISFSTADLEFAKQIGDMLEQISYIDDCDTLGQKGNKRDIHRALVLVYQKLLEFYNVAFEILTRKGAKLVMRIILENDRLPNIVKDFLKHADNLRRIVQKATWEIVEDIKSMLYDHEIHQLVSRHRFAAVGDLRRYGQRKNGRDSDDETGEAIYIFSALILSLLEQLSGLKKTFYEWYKQAGASGNFEPATNVKKLEEFFQNTLKTLDRPFFIVIDGLDECDRASRNGLLQSLKILLQKTPRLKILLSSSPQEEILEQLSDIVRINLDSNAKRDRIIAQTTVEKQLSYLSTDIRKLVIERLSFLAQGSALWTKMVVELIEIRKIRAHDPMRAFLQNIPQPAQLLKIYASLFSRHTSNDPENQKLAAAALDILAITRRPLSILELAWTVALDAAHEGVTTVAGLAKLVDHQRVMNLIQPFISIVDFSDVKKRQVRLVNQSVKKFIMRKWDPNQTVLTATDGESIYQRTRSPETVILDVCTRYLLLDDIGRINLFSEEQLAIEELPQEYDLFDDNDKPTDYDPCCTWEVWEENMIRYDPVDCGFGEFFVYASCYWLEHFGAVTTEPLPDLEHRETMPSGLNPAPELD
ncbi:hypothetical protein V496_05718 [Pseudogymnoascus sp. VKM F-4515 (FW-2607)]|nr:hypothetical protein V496_05718 [Pseudogymnoascus sp. VKM F-4515 (FW-2607)]